VFNVGALELEGLEEKKERICFYGDYFILAYYPETTIYCDQNVFNISEILLEENKPIHYIMGGADVNSRHINCNQTDYYYTRSQFIDLLTNSIAIIGNSSAGLMDAPALGVPSINIGDRQRGRLKASSVIDCEPNKESIKAAFDKLYSREFQESLKDIKSPYKGGNVSGRIIKILKEKANHPQVKKAFHDLFRPI